MHPYLEPGKWQSTLLLSAKQEDIWEFLMVISFLQVFFSCTSILGCYAALKRQAPGDEWGSERVEREQR